MPNAYEIQIKANKKALKYLTSEQIEVIEQTQKILNDVLDNIYDMQDINLSQIKELDTVYYRLCNKFDFDKEQ